MSLPSVSTLVSPQTSSFEVVGKGRIASLFLRQEGCISVSRDEAPGQQTKMGSPMVVATPSQAWPEIHAACDPARRGDLVWMGNGLPELELGGSDCTWVVPHFGVLVMDGPIVSAPTSPPTFVCGKHANFVERLLRHEGLANVEGVDNVTTLRLYAVRKLLWASCMWLLCHSHEPPLTVSEVHQNEASAATLQTLVAELLPAAEALTKQTMDLAAVLVYLEQYSLSMPGAIPSLTLAMAELADRNGVFYLACQQPCHERLLWKHIAADKYQSATKADTNVILQRLSKSN